MAKRATCRRDRQRRTVRSYEESILGLDNVPDESASVPEVSFKLDGERSMEWDPSRTSLRFGDEQHVTPNVDIAEPEAQRFAEPQSRAIQDQEKCSV
jgi:hypothetical protein